jgi:unsaturated rhamnogalacturonyl hydrolase
MILFLKNIIFSILFIALLSACSSGQKTISVPESAPWSKRIADSFLLRHPDAVTYDTGSPSTKWNYEQGLILIALEQMWLHSGDDKYFDFIRNNLDQYVEENGNIKTYSRAEYNIDHIGPGNALLAVYQKTKEQKYRSAADTLRQQLREHPRTNEGGFWHKKIYPYQMWLDGLFMAEPFYTKYAVMFDEHDAFDDIANQFIWMAKHTRDPNTGMLYHAWDESKQQRWANPETGCSSNFWARSMGWYAMALVNVLDDFPAAHPKRGQLIAIFKELSDAVLKFRDQKTHLWFQVVDQGTREGNYLETSASCMFAYSFAKGSNKGYLDKEYSSIAKQIFDGVIEYKVTIDSNGFVDLHGTCKSAGLGGKPYRDGSFEYYISEPQRTNDMKGIGPFLLAAIEIEKNKNTKGKK